MYIYIYIFLHVYIYSTPSTGRKVTYHCLAVFVTGSISRVFYIPINIFDA